VQVEAARIERVDGDVGARGHGGHAAQLGDQIGGARRHRQALAEVEDRLAPAQDAAEAVGDRAQRAQGDQARSIASTAASSLSVIAPSEMMAVELRRTAIGSALRAPNADSAWFAAPGSPTGPRRPRPRLLLRGGRLGSAARNRGVLGRRLQRRGLARQAADEAIHRSARQRGVLGEVLEGTADAGRRRDRHRSRPASD
jgi:hypothetical protein